MPFILELRKPKSPLKQARDWSECAGSKVATAQELAPIIDWWNDYDQEYKLEGWEYRVREVKK